MAENRRTIRIDNTLWQAFQTYAKAKGLTVSRAIRNLMREALNRSEATSSAPKK